MIASIVLWLLQFPVHAVPMDCTTCVSQIVARTPVPADQMVTGVVLDASGGVIAGAIVLARSTSLGEQETVTGSEGRFTLNGFASGEFEVIVRAGGFAEFRRTLRPGDARQGLVLTLLPASSFEEITVAGTRTELRASDVPASITVLTRTEIRQSPAVVADDVLRQLPSFSLFRRTSSLVTHPGAQGVSLRGIGPSGASRTLVMLDGVPFNDPFGGWVYWSRVPIEGTERIEVVDGAASSLYGNYAMGGLISIVTSPAARRTVEIKTQYGNLSSPKFDVRASDVWGKLGVSVDASSFKTSGYPTVVADERGPIDNNSTVDFTNVNTKFEYAANDRVRAFARVGYFREERDNGKTSTFDPRVEEANDTSWTSVSGGLRVRLPDLSELQASVFTDVETFHNNNIAVPDPVARDVGRLLSSQTVPSKSWGGMVQWARPIGMVHSLTGGIDWRWVDGESRETVYDAVTGMTAILNRVSGGTQRNAGAFFQDLITANEKTTITLSARLDRYHSYDGHDLETVVATGAPTPGSRPSLPDRTDTVTSPRAAILYHFTTRVSGWAAATAGFRAPTLNELYRGFRVGTRQTLANDQLGPERMVGSEGGISVEPVSHLVWRTTLFDTHVKDPISNVTISQSGADIVLERQNLGRTRTYGVQIDAEYRLGNAWRFSGAYLLGVSKVTEYAAPPIKADDLDNSLVGRYLPQVPLHRASVLVVYMNPRLVNVSASVQATGNQFDDDRNVAGIPGLSTPGLPKYAVVSLTASREFDRNFEVFVGVQNLFNQEYFVGTLPTLVGTPRLVNGGLRIWFRGR